MKIFEYHRMARVSKLHWWYVAKRDLLKKLIQFWLPNFKKSARILDIGAGIGANWPVLKQFGNVYGIEQSEIGVTYCHNSGWHDVRQADANKIIYFKKKFDLITILDVLYHKKILSDEKVLRQAFNLLNTGGNLIVSDCAGPEWYGPHDENNQARERYSLVEMEQKIVRAGFKIKHSSFFYGLTFPIFILTRQATKLRLINFNATENLPPNLLNRFLIWLLNFESSYAKKYQIPFGSSIFIVAKK